MDNGEKYTAGWLKSHYTAHFEVLYKETYKRLYLFASNFLRDEDLSELLDKFEQTGQVRFALNGNVLQVQSAR